MNDFSRIAELAVISDEGAARLVTGSTHANLVAEITSSAGLVPPSRARRPGRPGRLVRRLAIAAPVAAGLAVAVLVATSAGHPGQQVGPISFGPPKAEALTFTRHGHYIDVIVRDPLADERKFNAEFRAHHLDIRLKLVPASPSIVGTVVYADGGPAIKVITARGRCWTGGGGGQCPVGLRVPVDYHGQASLVFGRAARPGERYESTTAATEPGEILHGLDITGRTVAAVLAMLPARHATAAEYQYVTAKHGGVLARRVPLNWFVYSADPWAPGQVLLFVGKTRQQQIPPSTPAPVTGRNGQPVPAPTASPGTS